MGYKQELERKSIRDQKLYQYHIEHPKISSRDLGAIFKLSHARVCQIIKKQRVIVQAGLQDAVKRSKK